MTIRNLDVLFRPRQMVWLGQPQSAAHREALNKLKSWSAPLYEAGSLEELARVPVVEQGLAVIVEDRFADADVVRRLGALGCRALIWPM